MSILVKQLKENEAKIHDKLHDNITLLTRIYPTTKEFDSVFKKNMFMKSNKAAFQHVVYYLFKILDPELTREKIKSWPLYDVKLEGVFRTEVIAFVSCVNSTRANSNLPNLIASHLVTPGGLKFARFVLKLSVLVIYEHVKKNEEVKVGLLSPMRPCKDPSVTKIMLKNLKIKTTSVESEVNQRCTGFRVLFEEMSTEAQAVIREQKQVNLDLGNQRSVLKEKKSKIDDSKTVQVLTVQLNSLKLLMARMEKITVLCQQGDDLLHYLSSDKPVLQYKKDEFRVPNSVKHLFKIDADKLDLCHLFNSLAVLLVNENLEMPVFEKDLLHSLIRTVSELNEKCLHLEQKFDCHENDFVEILDNLSPCVDEGAKSRKAPLIVVTEASASYVSEM